MDLDWLRDFLALADHGNFSRAADARNVTQPAFSRRIRALEDWAGAPLFERGAQGATLTAAGTHFRPIADEITRTLDRARRDTKAIGERDTATLSIVATHTLSFTFFPGWIRQTIGLDAFGTLNLISDSLQACEEIMLSGEAHFLLCHHHAAMPSRFDAQRFASLAVGYDTLVPLCAPGPDGGALWPLTNAQRPPHLLAYSAASGLGRILAACQTETKAETVFTSHLAATLMTMAREGHGLAWLPLTMADDELSRGRLVRAAPESVDIPVEIRLFRSPDCRNRAADELWDQLSR